MAWLTENRRTAVLETGKAYLTDGLKKHLSETYFPRYPNKRAVLLPALHAVQHEYGWIPQPAMVELADFLDADATGRLPAWCPAEIAQFLHSTSQNLRQWSAACRQIGV